MRLLLPLLLLAVAPAVARAGEVEFVRIWPAWQEADAFDRIGEYFGAKEPASGRILVRTHPEIRAGFYFLTRVASRQAVAGARFELAVIRPDAPEPVVFSFPVAVAAGETVFQLGLTGPAWPGGKKANPVAWKLRLVDAAGLTLAEHKSFLWEKPAK